MINDDIQVTVYINNNKKHGGKDSVAVGIDAPKEVPVARVKRTKPLPELGGYIDGRKIVEALWKK